MAIRQSSPLHIASSIMTDSPQALHLLLSAGHQSTPGLSMLTVLPIVS